MKCPYCEHEDDKVVDSRSSGEGYIIRRRRQCGACGRRFTTYEKIEQTSLMVIKKDGRREEFNRHKLLSGIKKACEKRPVAMETLEKTTDEINKELEERNEFEVDSK
ncbi:MAG: transcriptional regulator NrdR, partial [Candidatus Omnitrophota bacterium]|nr:transcriptional regulator NrdR [Candidatus Omnitrophota bacterium]